MDEDILRMLACYREALRDEMEMATACGLGPINAGEQEFLVLVRDLKIPLDSPVRKKWLERFHRKWPTDG